MSWTVKLTGDASQNRPTNSNHGTALAAKVQAGVANENSFASSLSPLPRHRGFARLPERSSGYLTIDQLVSARLALLRKGCLSWQADIDDRCVGDYPVSPHERSDIAAPSALLGGSSVRLNR